MMRYKAVFSDIDGTLLDSKSRLSAFTAGTVRRITDAGILFVPVSGRMPGGIDKVMRGIKRRVPVVCCSGGLALDENGKEILSISMTLEKALDIKRFIRECHPEITAGIYSGGIWFADDRHDPRIASETEITGVEPIICDIAEYSPPVREVHKLLCIGSVSDIPHFTEDFRRAFPELAGYNSTPWFLEVMSGGVSKSGAISVVAEKYGIARDEIIAIGDGHNDTDMIKWAGLGIAMGNAPEDVKKSADITAPANDEDGAAKILNELIFGA